MEQLPPPRLRPAFAQFLWDRNVSHRKVATALQRSHEYVRRICLPFADPKRIVPDEKTLELIESYTGGAIRKSDFEAPALDARPTEVVG